MSFSHIKSLGGKNVQHIFAGGHHSWALLDYEDPEDIDYETPSPLRTPKSKSNISIS